MKKCVRCGQVKKNSEFGKNNYHKNGLQSYCKDCQKEYNFEKGKLKNFKRCSICGEIKPFSEFTLDKKTADGFDRRCKDCRKIQNKKFVEKTANKIERQYKTCVECGEQKLISQFHKDKTKADGHRNKCMACVTASHKLNGYGYAPNTPNKIVNKDNKLTVWQRIKILFTGVL